MISIIAAVICAVTGVYCAINGNIGLAILEFFLVVLNLACLVMWG